MTVEHLDEPDAGAARRLVADGIDAGRMIVIVGRCEVDYEGRASSYLGPGDRLVVLKPDGTLLVHKGEGRTPVNWQPPGSDHEASVEGGRLRIHSARESPEETIDVRFDSVGGVSAVDVDDPEELDLSGTEEDLRGRILDAPDLVEEGFEPVETEYRTAFGAVDLLGRDAEGRPVVVELKRRRVGPEAASQLSRYVGTVREESPDARGILVAPSITDSARALLDEEGLEHVELAPRP